MCLNGSDRFHLWFDRMRDSMSYSEDGTEQTGISVCDNPKSLRAHSVAHDDLGERQKGIRVSTVIA